MIQSALDQLLKDRTTFVIAHRLSTITHADMIVVMDHGSIRETGRHAELMKHRGLYYEMVQRQRESFDPADIALKPLEQSHQAEAK